MTLLMIFLNTVYTWALSKYGNFARISSKHTDVLLNPLQSCDLIQEAIIPCRGGEGRVEKRSISQVLMQPFFLCPIFSIRNQLSVVFWQHELNVTHLKLRERGNGAGDDYNYLKWAVIVKRTERRLWNAEKESCALPSHHRVTQGSVTSRSQWAYSGCVTEMTHLTHSAKMQTSRRKPRKELHL